MIKKFKIKKSVAIFCLGSIFLFWANHFVLAQEISKFEAATLAQFQKVAPGESLPVSLKLLNMGGSGRVDVQITYKVEDANKNILSEESETVAVETTASFIKQVKIPPDLLPGKYFVLAELQYPDQKSPAVTTLPFQVENKFLGFFLDQIVILAGTAIVASSLILIVVYFINKSRRLVVSNFDYNNVPVNLKPYYELISDIILSMRLHLGDKAVSLANQQEGLKVSANGEVLAIKKDPMEIVTLLTMAYEKNLGYNGILISRKALNLREKNAVGADKAEYKKTGDLLSNVSKYFVKK